LADNTKDFVVKNNVDVRGGKITLCDDVDGANVRKTSIDGTTGSLRFYSDHAVTWNESDANTVKAYWGLNDTAADSNANPPTVQGPHFTFGQSAINSTATMFVNGNFRSTSTVKGTSFLGDGSTLDNVSKRVFTLPSTGAVGEGETWTHKYAKVGTVTLGTQYHWYSAQLATVGANSGSEHAYDQHTAIRVKQQAAFGNNPIVEFTTYHNDHTDYLFGYVIEQNTPTTVVQIWAKIEGAHSGAIAHVLVQSDHDENHDDISWEGDVSAANYQESAPTGFVAGDVRKQFHDGNLVAADGSNLGLIRTNYTTSHPNYKVQLDGNGDAYVNVPWANTQQSTDVTLSGSYDYLTISGQEITVNQVDLSADVTGTLPVGNMAATALTTIQTATGENDMLGKTAEEGDVIVRTDQNKTYMHNGGTASPNAMSNFTLLATPTDAVTSVNGNTGAVTTPNTTYAISCADGDSTDEEKIVLTDSGSNTDAVVLEAGTGLSIARSGDKITFTNTVSDTGEDNQNAFSNVAVNGQTTVAADSATDTLTLVAGTNVSITTDNSDDSVTINSTGGTDTTKMPLAGGTFTGNVEFGATATATNAAPDPNSHKLKFKTSAWNDGSSSAVDQEIDIFLHGDDTASTSGWELTIQDSTAATGLFRLDDHGDLYIKKDIFLIDAPSATAGGKVVSCTATSAHIAGNHSINVHGNGGVYLGPHTTEERSGWVEWASDSDLTGGSSGPRNYISALLKTSGGASNTSGSLQFCNNRDINEVAFEIHTKGGSDNLIKGTTTYGQAYFKKNHRGTQSWVYISNGMLDITPDSKTGYNANTLRLNGPSGTSFTSDGRNAGNASADVAGGVVGHIFHNSNQAINFRSTIDEPIQVSYMNESSADNVASEHFIQVNSSNTNASVGMRDMVFHQWDGSGSTANDTKVISGKILTVRTREAGTEKTQFGVDGDGTIELFDGDYTIKSGGTVTNASTTEGGSNTLLTLDKTTFTSAEVTVQVTNTATTPDHFETYKILLIHNSADVHFSVSDRIATAGQLAIPNVTLVNNDISVLASSTVTGGNFTYKTFARIIA